MHWVMRMSRCWASSMKPLIRSTYCGAASLIRPAVVARVMIEVYVTWAIIPAWCTRSTLARSSSGDVGTPMIGLCPSTACVSNQS